MGCSSLGVPKQEDGYHFYGKVNAAQVSTVCGELNKEHLGHWKGKHKPLCKDEVLQLARIALSK